MFRGINNVFQTISRLKGEIDQLKSLPRQFARSFSSSVPGPGEDFSASLSGKLSPGERSVDGMIAAASEQEGVEEALIRAVIDVESGFDPEAVSPRGARGLMQLMPGTAEQLGVDPDIPEQNIIGGSRYLHQMLERFGGLEEALAAYNAGPRTVETYQGIPPFSETQNYVKQVVEKYRQLKSDPEGE